MTLPTELHRLDMGEAGCAVVKLTFAAAEITAALDVPTSLKRKNRRLLQRWTQQLFRRLDADERGLRIVTTSEGRVVSCGVEYRGIGAVLFA
jgi:hypothetical protein